MKTLITSIEDKVYLLTQHKDGVSLYSSSISDARYAKLEDFPGFKGSQSWSKNQYGSTLQTVVVDNKLYLLGRGVKGIDLAEYNPANRSWNCRQSFEAFSDKQGWNYEKYYSTLSAVALNGNIYLVGRGAVEIHLTKYDLSKNAWSFCKPFKAFSDKQGWDKEKHYLTLRVAVLNDNLYMVGRGYEVVHLVKYDPLKDEWAWCQSFEAFSDNAGWGNFFNGKQHYSTFQCVPHDNKLFLLGRGSKQLHLAEYDTNSGKWSWHDYADAFSNNSGWGGILGFFAEKYYSTIKVVTVGNSLFVVGRGAKNIHMIEYRLGDKQWKWRMPLGDFSDQGNWGKIENYSSFTVIAGKHQIRIGGFRQTGEQTGFYLVSYDIKLDQWYPVIPANAHTQSVKPRLWHIDSELYRSCSQDGNYNLLQAGEIDRKKVKRFYKKSPIPGMEIDNVQVIYKPAMDGAFLSAVEMLNERDKSSHFKQSDDFNESDENKRWRKIIHQKWSEVTQPNKDDDFPHVKLAMVWHGTSAAAIPSLGVTGYANLATTDQGFFGKGIYGTLEAEYAYRVYARGQGVLLVHWVASYSTFPVTKLDMSGVQPRVKLGGGNYGHYDTHFVPVNPRDPSNPNEVNYDAIGVTGGTMPTAKYHEVVAFESARCLPRYVVALKRIGVFASTPSQSFNDVLIHALNYAYQTFLKKPFSHQTGEDLKFVHNSVTIERPNHGLAHTIRTVFYSLNIIKAYNAMYPGAQITQDQAECIQLALVFLVVGRKNDMSSHEAPELYAEGKKDSANAFDAYVSQNLSTKFTDQKRGYYKSFIDNFGGHCTDDSVKMVFFMSHYLDLRRCLSEDTCSKIMAPYQQIFGVNNMTFLKEISCRSLIATGDRILNERDYTPSLFLESSREINACINKLYSTLDISVVPSPTSN